MYVCMVIQITEIYLSDIFGLHPQFLAHSSQNAWNFQNDKNNKSIFIIQFGLLSSLPEITSEPQK